MIEKPKNNYSFTPQNSWLVNSIGATLFLVGLFILSRVFTAKHTDITNIIILGSIFTVAGGAALFMNMSYNRMMAGLRVNGQRITAKIVKVITRGGFGSTDPVQWNIVAKWHDDLHNMDYEFVEDWFFSMPKEGDLVDVMINPLNPKRYIVDRKSLRPGQAAS